MIRAVTFDYGQTLAELDTSFLAERALERGALVEPTALDRASPAAWAAYEVAKRGGESAVHAWSAFMGTLLRGANTSPADGSIRDAVPALVEFLWSEQPHRNLWRKPIRGMKKLVSDLSEFGVPLGIVSNSEGRLAELMVEMELAQYFGVIADSGRLGFEKPDARIFTWTAERLGVGAEETVHVGDAWAADVEGALGVGASAIWVTTQARGKTASDRVVACSTADEIRDALRGFGIDGGSLASKETA